MKKYFLILLAVMAFVACNNEAVDDIDYSTWRVEELLTTGDGIDYLVKQSKEINFDELNERLKIEVLCADPQITYRKVKGKWVYGFLNGIGSEYCVLMEDNKFRHCYELEFDPKRGCGYETYDAYDNAAAEMIGKVHAWAKIVAYVGDTLVCEYESYGIPTRFLASIGPWRESVLSRYTRDFDNPQSWMGK